MASKKPKPPQPPVKDRPLRRERGLTPKTNTNNAQGKYSNPKTIVKNKIPDFSKKSGIWTM
ncbi:MAG: hypothetical protein C4323_14740 [Mastigocladus sp. ERB_26_2]